MAIPFLRFLPAVLLLSGFLASTPTPSRAAALTAAEMAHVERALGYLNNISTLRARFVQISSNGSYAEGEVLIDRPGRLRFEYDPPVPVLLIANGVTLLFYDRELQEASFLPLKETPLWFLVRDKVQLSDGMAVEKVVQERGTLRVTLRDTGNPDIGAMTLVFADAPLSLRKWQVVDAQGVLTEVSLVDPQYGAAIDAKAFRHDDLDIYNPGRSLQER